MEAADGPRWMEKVERGMGSRPGEGEPGDEPTSVIRDPAQHGSGNQSCNALIENLQVNVSSSLR